MIFICEDGVYGVVFIVFGSFIVCNNDLYIVCVLFGWNVFCDGVLFVGVVWLGL